MGHCDNPTTEAVHGDGDAVIVLAFMGGAGQGEDVDGNAFSNAGWDWCWGDGTLGVAAVTEGLAQLTAAADFAGEVSGMGSG